MIFSCGTSQAPARIPSPQYHLGVSGQPPRIGGGVIGAPIFSDAAMTAELTLVIGRVGDRGCSKATCFFWGGGVGVGKHIFSFQTSV